MSAVNRVHGDLSVGDLEASPLGDRDRSIPSRRLLLAALHAFAELGFHGTTTRDIARRAEMSAAAMYSHYSSKSELLHQISRITHLGLLRELQAVFAAPAAPPERMANLVRAHARYHAVHHTAARVANYELHSLDAGHLVEILALRQGIQDVMREALRLGIVSGDLRAADAELATIAVLSLGIDISRWYRAGGRLAPEEVADTYARFILGFLAGPEPVTRKAAVTRTSSHRRRRSPGP